MNFFFHPEGIALIGATANPQKGGYAILKNLVTGYKGRIYPVNPRYPEIDGVKCYPSVAEVPNPVDLAIVFVPGKLVPQIIRDCAARGIRGVMIESGGFAESGAQGRAMQEELKHIAQETGIRLWGPNCMGLVDAVNRCVFSFVSPTIWENFFSGNVSLVVQSGMLSGAFLIDRMSHGTMGISKVCSVGNKVDVNECDLLEYLIKDLETDAIGLYLESIPDGRHFMEICRTSLKPVVVLKGGKSPRGAAAAMSHTASMAGDKAVVSGALAQVGVTEAKDFDQMTDLCRTLALYPHVECSGRGRIAILTYSGGAGIVSADFIHECGLELAELSEKSITAMKTVFPDWMTPSNPIDIWPAVEQHGAEKAYGTAFRAACADPGVDAIFLHVFVGGFSLNVDLSELAEKARIAGKPVFCWVIGKSTEVTEFQEKTRKTGIPIYREISRAVECMNAVFARKRMMDAGFAREVISDSFSVSDTANALLHKESGALDEYLSKQILSGCGIPTVREEIVTKAKEAVNLLSEMGGPLVMKGLVPGQVHKSESGLVRLWISTEVDVRKHFKSLKAKVGDAGKILLQKQVEGGLELIAGMLRDPQFGPCVMFGLGGIIAEVLKDAVFASAPLTHEEALELIGRLKSQQMLNGFRGAEPADREALAQILVNLGRLGLAFPQIREIDINPLIVTKGKPVAVDASVIIAK